VAYAEGRGVPKDYVLAYMWLSLAGAALEPKAYAERELVTFRMTPDQIRMAQSFAGYWKATPAP
jgi:uncharacterized protein